MTKKDERRKITIFPPLSEFGTMKILVEGNSKNVVVTECQCGYRICVDSVIKAVREEILAEIVKKMETVESEEIRVFMTELIGGIFGKKQLSDEN